MTGKCCYGFAALLALLALAGTAAVHVLQWTDKGVELGITEEPLGDTWDFHSLNLVQTSWLLYIWVAVYTYQAIWLMYGLCTPCWKTKTGWLGAHPAIIPPSIYVAFLFSMGSLAGWLVLWNIFRQYSTYSVICLAGSAVFSSMALAISVYATRIHSAELFAEGHGSAVWSIRVFLHNGIASLVSWSLIYLCYVMYVILTRAGLAQSETSGFVAQGVTMGYLLIWFLVDILACKSTTAYVITPYLLVLLSVIMALYTNMADRGLHFTLSIIYAAVTGILLLIKISLTIGRYCRPRPPPSEPESFGAVSYEENHGSDTSSNPDELGALSDQMYLTS